MSEILKPCPFCGMVEILNRRPIQESFEHALVGTSVEAGKRRWEMSQDLEFSVFAFYSKLPNIENE